MFGVRMVLVIFGKHYRPLIVTVDSYQFLLWIMDFASEILHLDHFLCSMGLSNIFGLGT